MHPTRNDLPESVRAQVARLLNERLADAIDLQLQAKQAHWNVKGESFIALHELFDQVSTNATTAVDLLAERVVQLGGTAEGGVRTVAERSGLDVYPSEICAGTDHVEALARALAAFAARVRRGIDETDELGDVATSDLLTEITRAADKDLWFVEAHAEGARGGAPVAAASRR